METKKIVVSADLDTFARIQTSGYFYVPELGTDVSIGDTIKFTYGDLCTERVVVYVDKTTQGSLLVSLR